MKSFHNFYLIFVFLLLKSNYATAQESIHFSKGVYEYLDMCQRAEFAILRHDEKAALKMYKAAFKLNPKPFPNDLFNALVSSIHIKEDYAFDVLKKLALVGYEKECLSDTIFNTLKAKKNKWAKCMQAFDTNRSHFLSTQRLETKKILAKLLERDQNFRIHFTKDSTMMQDSINYHVIKSIFTKEGFPSDYELGIDVSCPLLFVRQPYQPILFELMKSNKKEFMQVLEKALYEGKIEPEVFASLTESIFYMHENKAYYFANIPIEVYDDPQELYYAKLSLPTVEVNANRKRIGLATVEEDQEKLIAIKRKQSNGHSFFIATSFYSFAGYPKEIMEDFKRNANAENRKVK